jgi:hypothetical protein
MTELEDSDRIEVVIAAKGDSNMYTQGVKTYVN